MRSLLLTPDFPPATGGIQTVMHRLARHARQLTIRVVTRDHARAGEFDRSAGLDVVRAGPAGSPRAAIASMNARALIEARRFRPDLVVSGHVVASPAALAIGRVLGVPVAQYMHADELRNRPRLAAFAARRAAATLAVSAHTERMAIALGADPGRVHRVQNGVDLPRAGAGGALGATGAVAAERAERPTIVTVARLEQRDKGHDVMLRALGLVRERVPDVEWLVVGDGSLRSELERLAAAAGLTDAVTFAGPVSDAQRDAILDRAHVFAMPSRLPPGGTGGEGFGIVYLEAAAHGLPAVAGNVGGAPDAVVDGQTGVLVDPTDPAAVADAIAGLLLDPQRAEAMGRAGVRWARELSWPLVVERIEELLLRVARDGTGGP